MQEIFGLNLKLKDREACGIAANHWAFLRCAREKIGKIETSLILEPTTGIEPVTSSFAYTSVYLTSIGGLDCIFLPEADPCQSFGRQLNSGRHGLAR